MITVPKTGLSPEWLEYFRRVQDEGEELIVTDNQVPVAKVVPVHQSVNTNETMNATARQQQCVGNSTRQATDESEDINDEFDAVSCARRRSVDEVFAEMRKGVKFNADPAEPETEEWRDV